MSAVDTSPSHAPVPVAPDLARVLGRFDRGHLEAFVTVAIDLLDVLDGDPDEEAEDPAGETVPVRDDPELDEFAEDDGDPDLEETDTEDAFVLSGNALRSAHGAGCPISDPGGGAADDEGEPDGDPLEANGDEIDGNGSEDDFMSHAGAGPGCPVSDPGGLDDSY